MHRILTTMFRFGLFDRTETTTPIGARRDGAVSRAAAEAGTVLLKNSDGVLPLRENKKVALIGPGAGTAVATGGGSSGVAALYKVSPLGAFTRRGVPVEYAEGMPPVDLGPQPALPSYAVTAESGESGEHGWTARYYADTAWTGDPALTRVDPWIDADPTGGIPAPGLPPNGWSVRWTGTFTAPVDGDYTFDLTDHARATLYLDGTSVLDNGGGFPGTTKSVTPHLTAGQPQYPGVNGVATYSEGLRVGYRHYDERNIEPLFPFGYGLSYTTFAYRRLTVHRHGGDVTVGADITNTGRRTGTEVPQLYVGAPDEPPAQLKGFTMVGLAPGRTRHVTFRLTSRSFASWDASAHAWRVAGGEYRVMVGAGSRDIRLRQSLHLPAM